MPDPQLFAAVLTKQLAQFEPGSREHRVRKQLLEARENSEECRALVLSRPDVAGKLCEYPIEYAKPEHWNGYIPPEIWSEKHNDSLRRAALIALVGHAFEVPT